MTRPPHQCKQEITCIQLNRHTFSFGTYVQFSGAPHTGLRNNSQWESWTEPAAAGSLPAQAILFPTHALVGKENVAVWFTHLNQAHQSSNPDGQEQQRLLRESVCKSTNHSSLNDLHKHLLLLPPSGAAECNSPTKRPNLSHHLNNPKEGHQVAVLLWLQLEKVHWHDREHDLKYPFRRETLDRWLSVRNTCMQSWNFNLTCWQTSYHLDEKDLHHPWILHEPCDLSDIEDALLLALSCREIEGNLGKNCRIFSSLSL